MVTEPNIRPVPLTSNRALYQKRSKSESGRLSNPCGFKAINHRRAPDIEKRCWQCASFSGSWVVHVHHCIVSDDHWKSLIDFFGIKVSRTRRDLTRSGRHFLGRKPWLVSNDQCRNSQRNLFDLSCELNGNNLGLKRIWGISQHQCSWKNFDLLNHHIWKVEIEWWLCTMLLAETFSGEGKWQQSQVVTWTVHQIKHVNRH